jgi:hypothetical protein
MNIKRLAILLVAAVMIASLVGWMFSSEDPPPKGDPAVLEAG